MRIKIVAVLSGSLFIVVSVLPGQQQNETPKPRFDELVREEMFSGLAGDEAAFSRAMKLCATRLAANPHDPETLRAWKR